MRSPARPPWPWLDTCGLLVFEALVLQGFTAHVDVHAGDEAMYQGQGLALRQGTPTARILGYGPVYSIAYALLQLLPVRGVAAQDAMGALVAVASTLLVRWAVAGFAPRGVALLAAAWWGSNAALLTFPLRIYWFTSCLYLLALGLAARGRIGRGLLCLTLAAINRQELLPWLLGAAVGAAILGRVRGERHLLRTGLAYTAVAVAAAAAWSLSSDARAHAWTIFGWFYAGNVERDFPGATSVASALLTNPAALAHHAARNLTLLPGMVARNLDQPFFHAAGVRAAGGGLATVLVLVGLWPARAARAAYVPGSKVHAEGKAKANAALHVVLWTSLLVVPGLLVIFPGTSYVLPLSTALLAFAAMLAGRGACRILRALPFRRRTDTDIGTDIGTGTGTATGTCTGTTADPGTGIALATAMLVALPLALGGPFALTPPPSLQGREVVRLLQRSDISLPAKVASFKAAGLLLLAERSAVPIEVDVDAARALTEADWVVFTAADWLAPHRDTWLHELTTAAWEVADVGYETFLFRRRP